MNRPADKATIRSLLQQGTEQIGSDSPRLDAEVLLAFTLGKPRSHLLAWPDAVPAGETRRHYLELVRRRAGGEPVAYITGQREFWSLPLAVTPDTLIPRPDTETLVARALELLADDTTADVADLGTGSGAIALAIAHERPRCRMLACDRSAAALAVATANARSLGLQNIEFTTGDWCDALATRDFDLIVSNPPYIPAADAHLSQGDVRFEPRTALAAGADGLAAIRRIIACAPRHLRREAHLLLEHGFDQAGLVHELLDSHRYRDIEHGRDTAGHVRITLAGAPR